jgi:uncharacterized protein YcfJ
MKTLALASLSALLVAFSSSAPAGHYHNNYRYDNDDLSAPASPANLFDDRARVIKAKPLYETVMVNHPETRCWNEEVSYYRTPSAGSYTPVIAGAILGGVIGNQFGGGRGKDAMTAAGAVLGGSVGNDLRKQAVDPHRYVTTEERCETVDNYRETSELVGYNVQYSYRGNTYWTRTANDPGEYIKVSVSVMPAEY